MEYQDFEVIHNFMNNPHKNVEKLKINNLGNKPKIYYLLSVKAGIPVTELYLALLGF